MLTIDEESGMTGAFGLKPNLLKGSILLNLDSEDEGQLYIGCAGGVDVNVRGSYTQETAPSKFIGYDIGLKGFRGGHSGLDIHLGKGNSNILLNRFLRLAQNKLGLVISEFTGGTLRNAIPRESFARVALDEANEIQFLQLREEYLETLKVEFQGVEDQIELDVKRAKLPSHVMTEEDQKKWLNAINTCPNGVMRMSPGLQGVVESSTNLAVVNLVDGLVQVQCLVRSSIDSARSATAHGISSAFELAGAQVSHDGAYPGWSPNPNSKILETIVGTCEKESGAQPEIKVIHAGLECGLFTHAYPHWDMISFGPTIRFPHSPDEKVHIFSVSKFFHLLHLTLEAI